MGFCEEMTELPALEGDKDSFLGYARPGGRAGTRNYIAVLSSVNCSASVARYVADRFRLSDFKSDFANVDGVVAFTHKGGCSYDPNHGHELLQRVIAGMARHPNIGGYVLVGLGCEVNQIPGLVKKHRLDRLRDGEQAPTFLTIQQTGGVRKTVESAVKAVEEMLPKISAANRTMQPVDKLALAMNCGGSDANSGISANPGAWRRLRRTRAPGCGLRLWRDHRDLRSGTSTHSPCGDTRSWRETRLADSLVGTAYSDVRLNH